MQEAIRDNSISWERRERWGRQLVEGVSQLHSQGFVHGTLTTLWRPVIDISDNVLFRFFKQKFKLGSKTGCYFPPEFRHLENCSSTTTEAECPNVTSKTDIFQLGLQLWFLAENGPTNHTSPICMRKHCSERGTTCEESHTEPIALPRLSDAVPKYFRDIVDACRAEHPEDRPPARKLLELFPSPNVVSRHGQSEAMYVSTSLDIASMGKRLQAGVTCDRCRDRDAARHLFHCCVCANGDFDLCHACYEAGRHCLDKDHLLVEMVDLEGCLVVRRYHSSVKSSGNRDIVEL